MDSYATLKKLVEDVTALIERVEKLEKADAKEPAKKAKA